MEVTKLLKDGKAILEQRFTGALAESSSERLLFDHSLDALRDLSEDELRCLKAALRVYALLKAVGQSANTPKPSSEDIVTASDRSFVHIYYSKLSLEELNEERFLLEMASCFSAIQGRDGLETGTKEAFWHLYEAWKEDSLPEEVEIWALESLAYLEKASRVSYEPDVDKAPEFLIYSYIAAAYALALQRREKGYSEENRHAFEQAWQASQRFLRGDQIVPISDEPGLEESHSFAALNTLVALNLFHIRTLDQRWEEALNLFALGLRQSMLLLYAEPCQEKETIGRITVDGVVEPVQAVEQEGYQGFRYSSLIGWDWDVFDEWFHDKALKVFENIRKSPSAHWDWEGLLGYCRIIIEYWPLEYGEFYYPGAFAGWYEAQGWLIAKLEPSELRDELRREEDEKAEQRLKRYFFDEAKWKALPERAQRSLIEADRVWFASRVGNVGTVLDQLRKVTDEIIFHLFWKPCCQWMDTQKLRDNRLLDFQNIREVLKRDRKEPSLGEFEAMLRSKGFSAFIQTLNLTETQREFVSRQLRKDLGELRRGRRSAEHGIGRILTRKEVEPLFSQFLGVGCAGILPQLMDLKLQLAQQQGP